MKRALAVVALLSLSVPPFVVSASTADTQSYVPAQLIVSFHSTSSSSERVAALSMARGTVRRLRQNPPSYLVSNVAHAASLNTIAAQPGVLSVQRNVRYHSLGFPNDTFYGLQWNLDQVNVPQAWSLEDSTGTRGGIAGVTVAVADTGAAYENYTDSHSALCLNGGSPTACVAAGATYAVAPDLSGSHFVPGYDFINNDTHPNDDNGHGTHVTGTVAATTDNHHGEAGIAFSVSIMPIKVLDRNGEGTTATIAAGLDFARTHGASVINLSLGATVDDPVLHTAITAATSAGITVVAASGNSNASTLAFPAGYPEVVAVGSVRFDRTRAFYSNYGTNLDLMAPGGDLGVDQNGDSQPDGILQETFSHLDSSNLPVDFTTFGQLFYEGTSMSAPHVAAAVALLRSAGASADDAVTALTSTATDLGAPGYDTEYGYGLLNVQAALASVLAPGGAPSGSISINSGIVATADPNVTLNLTATGNGSAVTDMAFSMDGTSFGPFEPFAGTRAWDLLNPAVQDIGDGEKTVWVKFRNALGTESSPVSDSIVLDRERPSPPKSLALYAEASMLRLLPFRRVGSQINPFATWQSGSDSGSGILGTLVSVSTKPMAASGVLAVDSGTELSIKQTGRFFVNLASVDYAGNRSTTTSFAVTRAPAHVLTILGSEQPHRLRSLNDTLGVSRRVTVTVPSGAPMVGVDLNGTGEQQLAVGDPAADRIMVWQANGSLVRTLTNATGFSGIASLAAIDIDHDGRDELVVGSRDGQVAILRSSGKRLKVFRPFGTETVPVMVAAGQLNGNEEPEVVTSRVLGTSEVRIFTPGGKRLVAFHPGNPNYRGGWNLAVLDLQGDGKNVLALTPRGRTTPEVRFYTAEGILLSHRAYEKKSFLGGLALAVGDIDGDGKDDLVLGPRIGSGPLQLLGSATTGSTVQAFGHTSVASVSLTVLNSFR